MQWKFLLRIVTRNGSCCVLLHLLLKGKFAYFAWIVLIQRKNHRFEPLFIGTGSFIVTLTDVGLPLKVKK